MDMARLDRTAARPLGGPEDWPLREPPELAPAPGGRALRETEAAGEVPVIALRTPPGEDRPTTAELLLILREVLGDQAVALPAETQPASEHETDILLLDHPLLDLPAAPALAPEPEPAEPRPLITTDGIDDDPTEVPVFGPAPRNGPFGLLRTLFGG